MHNEKRFFVPDILQIRQVKITFTHGKVINSIQDIGLSKKTNFVLNYECRIRNSLLNDTEGVKYHQL